MTNQSSNSDHSSDQVPEGETTTGVHLWLITVGGIIGIPAFIMSARIGGDIGLQAAFPAFVCGGAIVAALGILTSLAGAKTRMSTYMLIQHAFGEGGAKIINLIISISLIGWFGVIGSMFGDAAQNAWHLLGLVEMPVAFFKLLGCLLMIVVSISGFRGIDRLALIIVPFMLLFLVWTAVMTWDQALASEARFAHQSGLLPFSQVVSAVTGACIVGVIIQPDYSRFALNLKHAGWSVGLALGFVFPAILILSAIPSVATGEQDLITIMLSLGLGLPAFLLLLLSSWSSNVLCLYSSGLAISTVLPGKQLKLIVLSVGIVGTLVSLTGTQEFLMDFLILLGVVIPPVGAIYTLEVFLHRRGEKAFQSVGQESQVNWRAFVALLAGVGAGYLADQFSLSLVGIATIDTVFVSALVYALLGSWAGRNILVVQTIGEKEEEHA